MSLDDINERFSNQEACRLYLEQRRWGGNVACAFCGSDKVYALRADNKKKGFWHCNGCNRQFNFRTGTPFYRSKVPLRKWFLAFYYMAVSSISSIRLSKYIGITQRHAWHLEDDVRNAMSFDMGKHKFKNTTVECDETVSSGKAKNRHYTRKKKKKQELDGDAIPAVNNAESNCRKKKKKGQPIPPMYFLCIVGRRENGRRGQADIFPVEKTDADTLIPLIEMCVEKGCTVNTDGAGVYSSLSSKGYEHHEINHAKKIYVKGKDTTNTAESLWNMFDDDIKAHRFISKKHSRKYAGECVFRWNYNELPTMEQIDKIIDRCLGVAKL